MLIARFPNPLAGTPAFGSAMTDLVESMFADSPGFETPARTYPALNAWEDKHTVFIEAELPGFRTEDLDITVTGNELSISGLREDKAPNGATFIRRERPTGSFRRTLRLGSEVSADGISATFHDGILTITLPKAEAARPRKVEVRTA